MRDLPRYILRAGRFLFIPALLLFSQNTPESFAGDFLRDLLSPSPDILKKIDPNELRSAERLGIRYDNVPRKFFIGYDLPDTVKHLLRSGSIRDSLNIEMNPGGYSVLTISISGSSTRQKFYFKKNRCISPVSFFTAGWQSFESAYFSFRISDSSLFNQYSARRLDAFVEQTMDLLSFTREERRRLRKEKILYVRCADEEEIERITGFRTLGMAMLSTDAVVTQFNCHYHEIVHLLMNYKLRSLPLYTHPFFQEGIAVALGGRGGREPEVILDLGRFVAVTGYETPQSLLDRRSFYAVDPSVSYALAGLYHSFLLSDAGIEHYMKLYRRFSSSDPAEISSIPKELLPPQERWEIFLRSWNKQRSILAAADTHRTVDIWSGNGERIGRCTDGYVCSIRDTLKIFSRERRLLYIVGASSEEIRIVNAQTGNTVANFSVAFSSPPEPIPFDGETYTFVVRKSVFDEPLSRELMFVPY